MRQNSLTIQQRQHRFIGLSGLLLACAALLSACSTPMPRPAPPAPAPAPVQEPAPVVVAPQPMSTVPNSAAATPRAYRSDGARHLYGLNSERIFKGKMPPLLYAVGVLNIEIDQAGSVTRLDWMRAPNHAPEVVAEIERTVRSAAPFPAPARMGKVVYTDTWLWHKSGKFQLDTLTEGQN